MKWPRSITIVRHGQSTYNALRQHKQQSELYARFLKAFEADPSGAETRSLAEEVRRAFALGVSDYETPLTKEGEHQAEATGHALTDIIPPPDFVFASPYKRVVDTARIAIKEGGLFKLGGITTTDDRIREQEHGLSLLYNDWRVFHALHPEQRELRALMGPYWYQYPQGESVSQVRDRARQFFAMLIRECAGADVLIFTHHLTILSIRANLERLSPEEFIRIDEEEKPVNCGVTRYVANPTKGRSGRLELVDYNLRLY